VHRPVRRRRGIPRTRATARRLKRVVALATALAALGGAQASAALARALPLHDVLPQGLVSLVDQPLGVFVVGLLVGLWLQHERVRPEPKLPFPFITIRRGVSSAPRRSAPLDHDVPAAARRRTQWRSRGIRC
jgi:hypothetical protein